MTEILDSDISLHQLYHEMFDSYMDYSRLDELFATFISKNDNSLDIVDLINETICTIDSSKDSIQDNIVLFIFHEFNSRVNKDTIRDILKKSDFYVDRAIAKISAMPITGIVKEDKKVKKISLGEFLVPMESSEAEAYYKMFRKVNPDETFKSIVSIQNDSDNFSNRTIAATTEYNSNVNNDRVTKQTSRIESLLPSRPTKSTFSSSNETNTEWQVVPARRRKELENLDLGQWRSKLDAEYAEMVNSYRQAASMYRNNQANSCRAYAEIAAAHRSKLRHATLWYSKCVFEQYNPNFKVEVDAENESLQFADPTNDLSRTISFDLHCLFVKQMQMIALSILFFYLDTKSVDKIKFIVGKGLHSTGGVCKIRKNLTTILNSYGFDNIYDDGIIIVKL